MEGLTVRQSEILQLIRDHIEENGMPPTRAEIAATLGFRSVNAAEDHLKALERKGAIEIMPGTSRGIRLMQETGLPVIGRVAAGNPMLAEQHIETYYDVDPRLFKPRPHYLLRVKGMSMKNAGILDGDLLAVHRTKNVDNNQIVVARIGEEVTVKRFKRKWKNQVWLMPENPDFETIVVDLRDQNLTIEGLCVGVVRPGMM